ncbi:hypothetical protein BD769DRAFT_1679693 [Suillus cothurnatus]|nr:hypothetical protein BD769DRAFT_1679693 [Suillus cothurnatus]
MSLKPHLPNMSSTPPGWSDMGNIQNAPNMQHLYPAHHYLPPHRQQPFMQYYPQIPYRYAPPWQHYEPLHAPSRQHNPLLPHFTQQYAGLPQYPPTQVDTKIPAPPVSAKLSRAPVSLRMQPNLEAPAASPASSRLQPNPEPRPGVFSFNVDIIAGNTKHSFHGETDMPWEDFKSCVVAYLDSTTGEVQLIIQHRYGSALSQSVQCTHMSGCFRGKECSQTDYNQTEKRTCKDDVPPASSDKHPTQLKAYKQLESQIRCELHHGHCFIDRTSGYDDHCRLDHAEMTLWAKKIALGHTTIYNPPHCLNPDHGPAKRPRHSRSTSSPEVHVTIQNITLPLLQPCNLSSPPLSQPQNLSLPLLSQPCSTDNYPGIGALLGLINVDEPELQFTDLETSLLDAGVVSSSQVILLPEDVLSIIGNMGQKQARVLCNYAKRIILPLLGLINSYEEPEIQEPGTQNKGKEHAVEMENDNSYEELGIQEPGTQNKGKERAVEMEDDMWQEAGSWINQHESGEYDEYESDEEIEQDEEFLN